MEDSPELVKLLKYILFGYFILQQISPSHTLVIEPGNPAGPLLPYDEYRSAPSSPDLISSSFSENRRGSDYMSKSFPQRLNDLDTMGRKESQRSHNMPRQLLEKFGGSLCSIFKTFLEPNRRRFNRCHVGRRDPPQPRGPLQLNDLNNDNPHHAQEMMEMMMAQQRRHEMEMMMMMGGTGMQLQHQPPTSLQQQQGMMMILGSPPTNGGGKRYDENTNYPNGGISGHLEDEQINNSGEVDNGDSMHGEEEGIEAGHNHPDHDRDGHHHGDDHKTLSLDPTKISDRTMILVPERSCPNGQRRDARGYCRRLVKIRTNYEYGPPPLPMRSSSQQHQANSVVRPIPIRYYYSRIVTIPAFQFFYPNARV